MKGICRMSPDKMFVQGAEIVCGKDRRGSLQKKHSAGFIGNAGDAF